MVNYHSDKFQFWEEKFIFFDDHSYVRNDIITECFFMVLLGMLAVPCAIITTTQIICNNDNVCVPAKIAFS
jgi:hypothetical protein